MTRTRRWLLLLLLVSGCASGPRWTGEYRLLDGSWTADPAQPFGLTLESEDRVSVDGHLRQGDREVAVHFHKNLDQPEHMAQDELVIAEKLDVPRQRFEGEPRSTNLEVLLAAKAPPALTKTPMPVVGKVHLSCGRGERAGRTYLRLIVGGEEDMCELLLERVGPPGR